MSISSNSVFHHTSSRRKLSEILNKQAFNVQYSTEHIYVNNNTSIHIAVPMVSFCDIPLRDYKLFYRKSGKSKKSFELGYYGDYGIGLSKDWAIKNGLCPIIYLPKILEDIRKNNNSLLEEFVQFAQNKIPTKDLGTEFINCPKLASFCKHYEGHLYHDDNSVQKYRFYNEREWRYVPRNIPVLWNFYNNSIDKLNGKENKKNKNKELIKSKQYLSFTIFDITQIIVKSDDDILVVLKNLLIVKNEWINQNEIEYRQSKKSYDKKFDVLCTRITTTMQLLEDF